MNESQYWIAQGENVQGPFSQQQVQGWIAAGKVREEMFFSRDGGDWVTGSELPELFPPAAAAAPVAAAPHHAAPAPQRAATYDDEPPARSRRGSRAGRGGRGGRGGGKPPVPGAVLTVVILDFIGAALYGFTGVAGILLVAAAKSEGGAGAIGNALLLVSLFILVLAAAFLVLGLLIKGGSNGARITQIVLSGLGLLLGLSGLLREGISLSSLIGLAINGTIVVLLLTADAAAFFRDAQGGGRRRGGRGRDRGRRRRY